MVSPSAPVSVRRRQPSGEGGTDLGLPRELPGGHVEGRDHRDEAPKAQVLPSTRGDSRAHRPDGNLDMVMLSVEPQAGIILLRQPLSGNSSAAQAFGEILHQPLQP
jgi:hypothetical protein